MRRTITTLALTVAMLLGGASVALAHPQDATDHPGKAKGFVSNPLDEVRPSGFAATDRVSVKGLEKGIVPGYVFHSPTCGGHPTDHNL